MQLRLFSEKKEIQLRAYQEEALASIPETGAYLICLATGLGKTVVMSRIPRRGRMLILSHRDELVHQPEKYFDCSFGVEQGSEKSHGEEVISASVQSLVRRLDKFKPDDFDVVVIDEAHHSIATTYRKIINYFKPRLLLGFTATPNRNDGVGLKAIYQDIIYEHNLRWGIENGYLSNIHCLRVDIGVDLQHVAQRLGDYAPDSLERAMNIEGANEAIAEAYKLYAKPPVLIFCASVAHAEALAKCIDGAVAVKGGEDRSEIVQAFSEKKIPCLTNCMVFTEGTDLPNVQTVIVARPTKNVSLYCLDEQTEILTSEGWKKDVQVGEQVATYDMKTGEIDYSPALAKICRQLEPDEYFCSFHGQSSDIRVTNHHRMIISPRNGNGYRFVEAESLLGHSNRYHIPVAGHMSFKGVPLTDAEITFIGWVMTDGTINKHNHAIAISQSSHHVKYCQEIEQCIIDCGFKFGKHVCKRQGITWKQHGDNVVWTISHGKPRGRDSHLSGWSRLEPYISKDLSPLLFDMTESQFEVMLTAIWHADGHKGCSPDSKHISKGNKTFIERLQIMAILRGYRANIASGNGNQKNMWTVHIKHQDFISVSESHAEAHAHWVKEPHIEESCWCVQTEKGTLITRRNGKVAIAGNCQMVGRGTRLYPGKEYLTLIDCVGAGDNADLCTAPSLLGLDIEDVPPNQRSELQGNLFDIPEILAELEDSPQAWIKNVERVDLWAHRNNYDMHGVNYFRMPDGSMVLSEPRKIIPAEDSLGRIMWKGRLEPAQKVFDAVYNELQQKYGDKRALWDLNLSRHWGNSPATEKQKSIIRRHYPNFDVRMLTKFEAGQILTRHFAEPLTKKQKYILLRAGYDVEGLSKYDAIQIIRRLKGT